MLPDPHPLTLLSPVPITDVVVVVPAHNEQDLLDGCLHSLSRAAHRAVEVASVTVSTIVVLDSCTDGSASVAARHPVATVEVTHRNVGAARAAGFGFLGPDSYRAATTWFATTDADTRVDRDWLVGHLRHAVDGARAIAGTVAVDFDDTIDDALRASYRLHYRNEIGHPHVHGANLGVRALDYLAVGGFAPLVTGEDHDLVRRLELGGIACRRVCDIPVRTSGRLRGRAPDGMAGFLRSLEATA